MLLNQHRSGLVTPSPALHDDGNDVDDLVIYSGQMGRFRRTLSPGLPVAADRAAGGDNLTPEPVSTPASSTGSEGQSTESIFQSSGSAQPELMETHGVDWSPRDQIFLHAPRSAMAETVSFDQLFGKSEGSPPTMDISAPYLSAPHFPMGSFTSEQPATQISSNGFASESSVDPFQQLYAEMFAPDTGMRGADESNSSMNGGNMPDEDWALFMKESGLL